MLKPLARNPLYESGHAIPSSVGRVGRLALGMMLLVLPSASGVGQEVQALPGAHAHNDYQHSRPLYDALDHGFCSVEADVFLSGTKLLVGHTPFELHPERTLRSLYLEPLRQRVEQNGGSVYGDQQRLLLLIDIKTDAEQTYRSLGPLLAEYAAMLSSFENGDLVPRAVDVVISGNSPVDTVAAARPRYAAIDGRLSSIQDSPPVDLVPLVSESWPDHFSWDGRGSMPRAQRARLDRIVARVHTQNRRLRFWATPERTDCWTALLDAGVDIIGTDDLGELRRFLLDRPPTGTDQQGDAAAQSP